MFINELLLTPSVLQVGNTSNTGECVEATQLFEGVSIVIVKLSYGETI